MSAIRCGALLAAASVIAACSRGGNEIGAGDSAGASTAAATPAPAMDSAGGMAGMNMGRGAAKDADQEFLRQMSDHHEGLIQMATDAMSKGSSSTVQGDAHKLHTKQQEEQRKMIDMDRASYGETITPMVMGSSQSMLADLKSKSGTDYDRTFYSDMVKHHQEGIKMIDEFLPKVTKPELKQMAEKMKSDQQKEIAEFERKAKA